jgi:hypothetical protein
MKGLGGTKMRKLIAHGIISTKRLLRANPMNYGEFNNKKGQSLLPGWKSIVKAFYKEKEDEVKRLNQLIGPLEVEFNDAVEELMDIANAIAEDAEEEGDKENSTARPPLFSKFKDKFGYNGRCLSKFRIDGIVSTAFQYRRAFQESKMMGLRATVVKIDFNYKLASKIKVWLGHGLSFPPFKCLVTIHNEDGQTIFWTSRKTEQEPTDLESRASKGSCEGDECRRGY